MALNVPTKMAMSIYHRLVKHHNESRATFILFAEFVGFVSSITVILGIGFIRDWLL